MKHTQGTVTAMDGEGGVQEAVSGRGGFVTPRFEFTSILVLPSLRLFNIGAVDDFLFQRSHSLSSLAGYYEGPYENTGTKSTAYRAESKLTHSRNRYMPSLLQIAVSGLPCQPSELSPQDQLGSRANCFSFVKPTSSRGTVTYRVRMSV